MADDDQTPAVPPAGAENEGLAQQALGDVPVTPAPEPPTPEEMAAAAAQEPTQTVPAVPVNEQVNATNPSNVQNAEVNPNVADDIVKTDAEIQETQNEEVNATPAAEAAAEEAGVDLTTVEGTGVDGKVTKPDVVAAAEAPANPSDVPASAPATPSEPEAGTVDLGPSNATQWVCLTDTGARSSHPPFGSNSHLVGVNVTCPTCVAEGKPGTTVIRQEGFPQQAP